MAESDRQRLPGMSIRKRLSSFHRKSKGASASHSVLKQSRSSSQIVTDDPSMPLDRKIAIVGIGCRYANGIDNVKLFWEMLSKGLDCTTPPPADRFDVSYFLYPGNKLPGKMYNLCAGYLKRNPEYFDRQFFKISPEEAGHLDPQIRLLLEVVWECLEDAGMPPPSIRGSNTGVYVGVTASEYGVLMSMPNSNINQYTNSGTNTCMSSNRISYEFDLRGPSFTVDTACSSSLYAVHLACEAIRSGECEMAIAGGANISLLPVTSIGFCQAGMLSPDGKCKSFDQSADGYARGEGAGAVILKPLKRALEDGDRVYAVIRGGALSNDGRTPGIANPSFDAQISLMEKAYDNANVSPGDVVYVEAHGTGTQAGDKTEACAIGEALGLSRGPQDPFLYIGSVKSNFGHSEGAAGIAGIIKTALTLYHGKIPRVVHFNKGNEQVDWTDFNMRVPTELTRWPKGSKRIAGSSSFGFGGANAHLVLEGFEQISHRTPVQRSLSRSLSQASEADSGSPSILFLSASSEGALQQAVVDWHKFLSEIASNDARYFGDVLYTAAIRRTHHQYRLCVIARSPRETAEQLRLKIEHDPRVAYNVVEGKSGEGIGTSNQRLVFVFSGMGSQWWGMARQLAIDEPRFSTVIRRIDKILRKCGAKWSLVSLLTEETDKEKMNYTDIAQPAICAVQIALAELYAMWGVIPDAVVGHSVGEVAAAHVAGLLPLESAIRLIYIRGRQLRKTSGMGSMVAVLHPVDDIRTKLESSEFVSVIDIACINSPKQVVLSGDKESLNQFTEFLRKDGIRCITLKVKNAFHSYQQQEVHKDFIKRTKFLNNKTLKDPHGSVPQIPIVSTISGKYLKLEEANTADYWWRNIRQPVLFKEAIEKLAADGYSCFLEVSPHPVLSHAIRDITTSMDPKPSRTVVTSALRRPNDTREVTDDRMFLLRSLAKLHVEGYEFDLRPLYRNLRTQRIVSLPTYPWQRVFCSAATEESSELFRFPAKNHPLLGKRTVLSHLSSDNAPSIWTSNFTACSIPWLQDHKLQGSIVLPAAAFTETLLKAATDHFCKQTAITLRDIKFERFVFVAELSGTLETTIEGRPKDADLTIKSFSEKEKSWAVNCKASLDTVCSTRDSFHKLEDGMDTFKLGADDIRRRCPHDVGKQEFYKRLWKGGFHLGDMFKCTKVAYFSQDYGEALIYASITEALEQDFKRYNFHPALLDVAFQGFGICEMFRQTEKARASKTLFRTWFQVPRSVKKVRMEGKAPKNVVFHVQVQSTPKGSVGNVVAADATNQRVFAQWDSIEFQNVHSNEPQEKVQLWRRDWTHIHVSPDDSVVTPVTRPKLTRPLSAIGADNPGAVIIIKDKQGVASDLKRRMEVENVVSVLDSRILFDGDERFRRVLRSLGQVTDIILLSCLDVKELPALNDIKRSHFVEAQKITALTPVHLYRAIRRFYSKPKPRLWLVTQGCQAVLDVDSVDPLMTSTGTFGVTLMHEDPEFPLVTVDLPAVQETKESSEWLHQYMKSAPNNENFVALRRRVPTPTEEDPRELAFDVYAPRIVIQPQSTFSAPTLSTSWLVDLSETINQKRLVVKQKHEETTHAFENEEISVKVAAFAMQQPKQTSVSDVGIGFLFAGKIITCNEEVQALFRMRSNVLGFRGEGQVASILRVKTDDLIAIPTNLTCVEAVNIIRDYLPAFVAFHDSLKLTQNGSVIISLSSLRDRIGLATTHIALEQGASVYLYIDGDDGNILPVEKLLGILGDSRVVLTSNDNFDTMINDTSVDVLLFAGEITQDSTSLKKLVAKIKPFGNIVQIHGRSSSGEAKLNSLPANVYYLSIDMALDRFRHMKSQMQDAMSRLLQLFSVHNGFQSLKSLTIPTVPISKLSRSPHAQIDEITVCVDEDSVPATLNFEDINFSANGKAAYLITGGSRGFGLHLVEWLVQKGARHVYVISRNTPEEEAILKFKEFRDLGARIIHLKVDMSKEKEVEKALSAIMENEDFPLEGIFHCAVRYEDVFLDNVSTDSWNDVLLTKAFGAVQLHKSSVHFGFHIRYFVMLSSIVEIIGNEGQGNYHAANAFLTGLAIARRKLGLPATIIAPGVIHTSGFAAREGLDKQWESFGLSSLSPAEVLKGLGCILATEFPQLSMTGSVDRQTYAKSNSPMMAHHFSDKMGMFSLLKNLYPSSETFVDTENSLRTQLRILPPDEAQDVTLKTISEPLKQRLGISGDISPDSSLVGLGLDSHMSSELSTLIYDKFAVSVTAMDLLNDTLTLRSLCVMIHQKVLTEESMDNPDNPPMLSPFSQNNPWFKVMNDIESPLMQLICIPSVGAGPSLFSQWVSEMTDNRIQLTVVKMPGWESREQEQPVSNIQDLLGRLADTLLPCLMQGPFSFFGHSLGALVCFELSHYLGRHHNLHPSYLFVSGWYPPSQPYPHPHELEVTNDVYRQMDRTLTSYIGHNRLTADCLPVKFSFLDQSLLQNPQLLLKLTPSIKAAILLCKKYKYRHREKLTCHMATFAGKSDSFVNPSLMDGWSREITSEFQFQKFVFPGKHMFIWAAGAQIVQEIINAMEIKVQGNTSNMSEDVSVSGQSARKISSATSNVAPPEEEKKTVESHPIYPPRNGRPVPTPRKSSQSTDHD
ncbi:Highly reducing polyketide synthase sor1 [Holothuria leucospilota]|uniref:oleoyl-[acyl-carrier-protein] hydrolase n=1 Tax=Holothuria leucospilota TaxID=206669 RepID=A0A9Q1GXT2_HOLLE|nr:Highly reducing polyketide synthase sor1 [Holothuria leucospilota]